MENFDEVYSLRGYGMSDSAFRRWKALNRHVGVQRFPLHVEQLEGRQLLAIVVDTLDDIDDGNHTAGNLSLRESVGLANSMPGHDEVIFDLDLATTEEATVLLSLGELEITESLTIDATSLGTDLVIDAQGDSRVLNYSSMSGDLTLHGITIRHGRTRGTNMYLGGGQGYDTEFNGGGVKFVSSGLLVLDKSVVEENVTQGWAAHGGGVFAPNGSVSIVDSDFRDNRVGGRKAVAGGIYAGGDLQIKNSTIEYNRSTGREGKGGAIFADSSASIEIVDTTISGNLTDGLYAYGGGLYIRSASTSISGSTISQNYTRGNLSDGGGMFVDAPLEILNSTITENFTDDSNSDGGGIFLGGDPSRVTIANTIIANNRTVESTGPDLWLDTAQGQLNVSYSLIGVNTATGLDEAQTVDGSGNLIGTAATPVDPMLGPLTDNSGRNRTHALLPTSPAIDAGSATDTTNDARGFPFSRTFDFPDSPGSTLDMGAYELQVLPAEFLEVDVVHDRFDLTDSETTLRESVWSANGSFSEATITFAPNVFSTDQTITLSQGELNVVDSLVIDGSSASGKVILDGAHESRLIRYDDLTGDLTIVEMTIQDGRLANHLDDNEAEVHGGAIYFASDGTLSLVDSEVVGNVLEGSRAQGGAIYIEGGHLSILRSTISNNSTFWPAASGGAISALYSSLEIRDSVISSNHTMANSADGGALYLRFSNAEIYSSTLNGNTVGERGSGAGIETLVTDLHIVASTISGNQTLNGRSGGGINMQDGNLFISESTITNNTGGYEGGGVALNGSGQAVIANSIVAGNTASRGSDLYRLGTRFELDVTHTLIGSNANTGLSDEPGDGGNLIGTRDNPIDAELGLLDDNGGLTPTHRLLEGSPAINAGSNQGLSSSFDQRGDSFPRIVGGVADMGATEAELPVIVSLESDISNNQIEYQLGQGEFVFIRFELDKTITENFGGRLTIDTNGSSLITDNDTEIGVFDGQGNLVAQNDNVDESNRLSALSFGIAGDNENLEAGTYYVALAGNDATFGNANFEVTTDSLLEGEAALNFSLINADINNDQLYNCADVDLLVNIIAVGMNPLQYDLTGDGLVDTEDLSRWLSEAAFANGRSAAYLPGDANLDGSVDVADFNAWNENKFTSTPAAAWCDGDFTADGVVDVSDFAVWNMFKFTSSSRGTDTQVNSASYQNKISAYARRVVDLVFQDDEDVRS